MKSLRTGRQKARDREPRLRKLERELWQTQDELREYRTQRNAVLEGAFGPLVRGGLIDGPGTGLDELRELESAVRARLSGQDLDQARDRLAGSHSIIAELDRDIQNLEEEAKQVEDVLVANATVVACTLTAAYLRSAVVKRRNDTVVLDEASIAPIPAAW